jgi:hypothetical protein
MHHDCWCYLTLRNLGLFRDSIPTFTSLREFEWIGYPEMQSEMVEALYKSHPRLQSIGLMGWHFDAKGVSKFNKLRKFTLRAEDDDGMADMGEIATVLDNNAATLRHLCLGAYLARDHSWDMAFQSVTIKNLTHLDLVDTRISHIVLARIAHAHQLQSLTLHGTFEEPSSASVVFGSDHVIDGRHTFLPHLESFRFVLVGHDDEHGLFQNVAQFLKHRPKLRRLDLGNCPWDLVSGVLKGLKELQVLRVRISNLTQDAARLLVDSLPRDMSAIHLAAVATDKPIVSHCYTYARLFLLYSQNEYAPLFAKFRNLSMLHLNHLSRRRPLLAQMSEKDHAVQSDLWNYGAKSIPMAVPSLDFVGWNMEHYVVERRGLGNSFLERELSTSAASSGNAAGLVEMKELPARRKLDCSKGVDLGSDDAWWLERKDVPIDYELPTEPSTA